MLPALLAIFIVLVVPLQLYCFDYLLDGERRAINRFEDRVAKNTEMLPRFPEARVSVVICARNEAGNLEKHLAGVLLQDYHNADGEPMFEVVVVNDGSSDATAVLLRDLASLHKHLNVVSLTDDAPRIFPGKKHALSVGIAAAQHEIILMTDADCSPQSSDWIKWMAFPFSKGAEIVGGFGGYHAAPGFLNKFIRCETLHTFMLYNGFARMGRPYMAVGRNLACRKQLIAQAQANPLWIKTASGDDDLLIRLCGTGHNMVVNAHPHSHTASIAKKTWSEYISQKRRHVSTGRLYAPFTKRFLGCYALSHSLFWLFLLFFGAIWVAGFRSNELAFFSIVAGIMAVLRFLKFFEAFRETARLLQLSRSPVWYWPVFDFCWMLYNIILSPYILWKTKQRWQ